MPQGSVGLEPWHHWGGGGAALTDDNGDGVWVAGIRARLVHRVQLTLVTGHPRTQHPVGEGGGDLRAMWSSTSSHCPRQPTCAILPYMRACHTGILGILGNQCFSNSPLNFFTVNENILLIN